MQVDSLSSQRIIKYLTVKRAVAIMEWEKDTFGGQTLEEVTADFKDAVNDYLDTAIR